MMKRRMILLMTVLLVMAGCGNGGAETAKDRAIPSTAGVKEILEQQMAASGEENAKAQNEGDTKVQNEGSALSAEGQDEAGGQSDTEAGKKAPSDAESGTIDVDLTALSSTMVYSEVYNMMIQPDRYIGKTVKMQGSYYMFHDINTDLYYYSCIIQDATACCSQGLEFILTEDYAYPEDYPAMGDEITVIGVFDTYMEGKDKYCTLRDSRLL